jgi:hypothetical protein
MNATVIMTAEGDKVKPSSASIRADAGVMFATSEKPLRQ